MSSAGKWVLGLLLLVVGAVFVAKTVSSDPGSQAEVKNLPAAPAAEKTKKAPAGPVVAADVVCKKSCVEVNEVGNDSITTAKIAPGSVTLSKLAFEVPNLNELENEINARKATESSLRASQSALSATQAEAASAAATAIEANAKNAAAINAAAANGITAEAAARQAADEDLASKVAAGDADLQTKLNKEGADRAFGDDVLQGKLNTEIQDRKAAVTTLYGELANPNEVVAPILKINNNEIVADAVRGGTGGVIKDASIESIDIKNETILSEDIFDGTITAADLGLNSVVGGELGDILDNSITEHDLKLDSVIGGEGGDVKDNSISEHDLKLDSVIGGEGGDVKDESITAHDLDEDSVGTSEIDDDSVAAIDLANNAVVGRAIAADSSLVNIKLGTIRGEGAAATGTPTGDIALGTITGQGDNDDTVPPLGADAATIAAIAAENARVTGNLGIETVGRRNLVNGAVDATKLSTTFLGDLVTEGELAVLLASLKADELGGTAPKDPNDGDGFLHWNHLEGVPDGILGSANLAFDDGTPNENTGPTKDLVSFSEIKDLTTGGGNGRITSTFIEDGTLTADDLGNNSVESAEIKDGTITNVDLAGSDSGTVVTGAVTSAKIADDNIESRDIKTGTIQGAQVPGALAAGETNAGDIGVRTITALNLANDAVGALQIRDGSITARELEANAVVGSSPAAALPAVPAAHQVIGTASLAIADDAGKKHKVAVNGALNLDCVGCAATGTVAYQLFADGTAAGPVYTATISDAVAPTVVSIAWIDGDAVSGSPRVYEVRAKALAIDDGAGAAEAMTAVGTLTAVDLGRVPTP